MTKKNNQAVEELFNQIILTTSNKFDPKNKTHEQVLSNLATYLCRFGPDMAYEVLAKYQYISTGSFFEWSKILDILKDKLSEKYLTVEDAYLQMKKMTGLYHTAIETPPNVDALVQATVDKLGGWQAVGANTNPKVLENSFKQHYSQILEKTIAAEMEKNAI